MGILRVITAPFRLGRTVRKAGGGAAASAMPEDTVVQTAPARPYTALFAEIGRPKLPLVSASEFDLDAAKRLRAESDAFYSQPFALFPSGTLFYEEVEREELTGSLGHG